MAKINQDVYLVDGFRTPFLKAKGQPGPFSAAEMCVSVVKHLLLVHHLSMKDIHQLILGCVVPAPDEANLARIVTLRVDPNNTVPAYTVQRNCGSGLQAIDNAFQSIRLGQADIVIAGGCDVLSHSPIMYDEKLIHFLAHFRQAKSIGKKLKVILTLRPSHFRPIFSLLKGLIDPTVGLSMGQTAENLAFQFGISRNEMDNFAVMSHRRLMEAYEKQLLPEVIPLYSKYGYRYIEDTGLRKDTSIDSLAKLPPFFDKPYGLVTAGNSSQVTDGAAVLLLANAKALKQFSLQAKARIKDISWAALDPAVMGLGPVYAIHKLLTDHQLQLNDIAYWEINEAFAAQVIACIKALNDTKFCKEKLGRSHAWGEISHDQLNIHGGAISVGHPLGASGARLTIRAMNNVHHQVGAQSIASMCIGGGQGGAILLEGVKGAK